MSWIAKTQRSLSSSVYASNLICVAFFPVPYMRLNLLLSFLLLVTMELMIFSPRLWSVQRTACHFCHCSILADSSSSLVRAGRNDCEAWLPCFMLRSSTWSPRATAVKLELTEPDFVVADPPFSFPEACLASPCTSSLAVDFLDFLPVAAGGSVFLE